jgi:FKBP-type peptidyl-prolyl cis-trans isomerase
MRARSLALPAALLAGATVAWAQPAEAEAEEPVQSAEAAAAERTYHNAQQAYLSGLMAQDGWYAMEGGLRWRYVDYRGTGDSPEVSDTVTVHYEGSFIDGEVFDSSFEGGEPATFPLGGLIPAWRMAIPQMRVGETIELAAPASLAYGPRGRGPIPGGATLLFRVQLIGIEGR